jgi:hypothetical protein
MVSGNLAQFTYMGDAQLDPAFIMVNEAIGETAVT